MAICDHLWTIHVLPRSRIFRSVTRKYRKYPASLIHPVGHFTFFNFPASTITN